MPTGLNLLFPSLPGALFLDGALHFEPLPKVRGPPGVSWALRLEGRCLPVDFWLQAAGLSLLDKNG